MEKLFESFDVVHVASSEQVDRAEAHLGVKLPESYRSFVTEYGFGLSCKLFMIYIPLNDLDSRASVTGRVRLMKQRLEDSKAQWQDMGLDIGLDVWDGVDDPGLIDRAMFFGSSENGEEIFWDVKGEGEYDIYVDCRGTIRFGGRSLDDFIRRCQTDDVKQIFGTGYEALQSMFEGRDLRPLDAK